MSIWSRIRKFFSFEYNIGAAPGAYDFENVEFVPSEIVPEGEMWLVDPKTGKTGVKIVNLEVPARLEPKDEK